MVKLGFIKDASQGSHEFPRVIVRPGKQSDPSVIETTVNSWPDNEGNQVFELALNVAQGVEHLDVWVPRMAGIIKDMGWSNWWLDTNTVSMVLNRYLTEALRLWGLCFFKHYEVEGVILLQVGLQREAVAQSVMAWEEAFPNVAFDAEYDLDARDRESSPQNAKRSRSIKSSLFPKLLGSKQKAS